MTNQEYKAAGARAGQQDARNRERRGSAQAWFHYACTLLDRSESPAGRHLFEGAYERAYELSARSEKAARKRSPLWQWNWQWQSTSATAM